MKFIITKEEIIHQGGSHGMLFLVIDRIADSGIKINKLKIMSKQTILEKRYELMDQLDKLGIKEIGYSRNPITSNYEIIINEGEAWDE